MDNVLTTTERALAARLQRTAMELEQHRNIARVAAEGAYQQEIVQAQMEHLVGEGREFSSKEDWVDCKLVEWAIEAGVDTAQVETMLDTIIQLTMELELCKTVLRAAIEEAYQMDIGEDDHLLGEEYADKLDWADYKFLEWAAEAHEERVARLVRKILPDLQEGEGESGT